MKDFLFKKLSTKQDFSFVKELTVLRADWNEINSRVLKLPPLEFNHIVIQDTYKFIEYQFELLDTNNGNEDYIPLLKRLSNLIFDILF
tara:strand:+ start:5524 stop:5787 length:264 start_codon:yes stop_codon:yes gene_type:complete